MTLRRAALVVLLLAGCEWSKSAPGEGRGMDRGPGLGGGAPGAADDPYVPPSGEEGPARARLADSDPARHGATGPGAGTAAEGEPAGAAGTQEERRPGRDLEAELRARIGEPGACFRTLPPAQAEVTVQVEATVTGTGVITRAYASGQVPEEARDCLVQRLDGARLAGPIENAPRTIRTSLTLRRAPPEKQAE